MEVVEPELSYKIIGIAFKVSKELGFGYSEKHYQRAFELELKSARINYNKEDVSDSIYKTDKILFKNNGIKIRNFNFI